MIFSILVENKIEWISIAAFELLRALIFSVVNRTRII